MSSERLFLWSGHTLAEADDGAHAEHGLDAADSLFVGEGCAFALDLHRERFTRAVTTMRKGRNALGPSEIDAFWHETFAMIPAKGQWFPRLELHSAVSEFPLAFRHRPAPELTRSVTLLTHGGPDPRGVPSVKGPDLEALSSARNTARERGADDVVLLTREGHIIDCAANALVWWRGNALCAPPLETEDAAFARVQSVTAKSVLALAAALGVETRSERATPADLDGCEVWALNALHGIRMVTGWADGPELAEKPGRIAAWRERRHALHAPIGGAAR